LLSGGHFPFLTCLHLIFLLFTVEWTLSLIKSILSQIAEGMFMLHNYGILHRDLKPTNVLLKKAKHKYLAKICDFGSCRRDTNCSVRRSVVGTPSHLAPEIYGKVTSLYVSKSSDIYAFGVIMWEVLTAQLPFKGHNCETLGNHLRSCKESNQSVLPLPEVGATWRALVERCISVFPEQRPADFGIIKDAILNC